MIFVGIGSNLPTRRHATPLDVCRAALSALRAAGVDVVYQSSWYETAPVPASDQPWFVNAVVAVATDLGPGALLTLLHRVEADFGRVRRVVNEARPLDLDLLDYDRVVRDDGPVLPHPRMHLRAFVLHPLAEIAPLWRHPVTGAPIRDLIAQLPPDQGFRIRADG